MSKFIENLKQHTYTPNKFYDYLGRLEKAMSGDVSLAIAPAMTGESGDGVAVEPTVAEANDDYVLDVTVKLQNTANEVLEFYNGSLEVKVICDSTAGTVAINDEDAGAANADVTETLAFVDGVLNFTITLGGTWAENDTVKLTIDDDNVGILGYTVEKNDHFLIDVDANE